ncbi:MAG: hypothetical protein AAF984_09670 [Verrucomicrobiota bacterium]
MTNVTPLTLFKISQYNPTVNDALARWQAGECSWEQALMDAVATLTKVEAQLTRTINQMAARSTQLAIPQQQDPGAMRAAYEMNQDVWQDFNTQPNPASQQSTSPQPSDPRPGIHKTPTRRLSEEDILQSRERES